MQQALLKTEMMAKVGRDEFGLLEARVNQKADLDCFISVEQRSKLFCEKVQRQVGKAEVFC